MSPLLPGVLALLLELGDGPRQLEWLLLQLRWFEWRLQNQLRRNPSLKNPNLNLSVNRLQNQNRNQSQNSLHLCLYLRQNLSRRQHQCQRLSLKFRTLRCTALMMRGASHQCLR